MSTRSRNPPYPKTQTAYKYGSWNMLKVIHNQVYDRLRPALPRRINDSRTRVHGFSGGRRSVAGAIYNQDRRGQ